MCGIAAIIGTDQENKNKFCQNSLQLLHHRGPDTKDAWIDEKIGLVHTRLSILDLSSAGSQPMKSSCGRYVMVYNGEVYNHLELRKKWLPKHAFSGQSDSETIIELFRLKREAMLPEMVGMWAILIWDQLEQKLFASRDRYGQKPLYLRRISDHILLSSEIKPLLKSNENTEPNYTAIVEYLATGNYGHLGEQTFFRDILHFPPASFAYINLPVKKINFYKYWNLPSYDEKDKRPFDKEAKTQIRKIVVEAVLSQTISDVPIGITLSGGLDSTIIAGILSKYYLQPVQVFSAISPNINGDESAFINKAFLELKGQGWELNNLDLSQYSIEHEFDSILGCQEEPFGDPSIVAHYLLMELARKKDIKVILGGQGADEIFMGYSHSLTPIVLNQLFGGNFKKLISNYKNLVENKSFWWRSLLAGVSPELEKQLRIKSRINRRKFISPEWRSQIRKNDIPIYKQNRFKEVLTESIYGIHLPHLLHYDDRNAMNFGVEGRSPFLDHRILEVVSTIKVDEYLVGGRRKYLLRESCKEFMPETIYNRMDKNGFFTPLFIFLNKNIKPIELTCCKNLPINFYNNLKPAFAKVTSGISQQENNLIIWRSYMVAKWIERFFSKYLINA